MRDADQLLARLKALAPADRRWLIENASAATRDRLAALLRAGNTKTPVSAPAPEQRHPDRELIAGADPKAVLEALKPEPSWVVAAVFQSQAWPWIPAVREQLPAMRRPQAAIGSAHTTVFTEALLRRFAERLRSSCSQGTAASPPVSRFEQLVQRFTAKSAFPRLGT